MENPITQFYSALTAKAERALAESGDANRIQIQIGSATCEHAAGSLEALDEFRKHIQSSGRDDIVLHQTGCTGRCSKEPIVGVTVPGKMPVKYERVTREVAHKIFVSHIQKGEPLPEHALDGSLDHQAALEFVFCEGLRCTEVRGMRERFEYKLKAAGIPPEVVKTGSVKCFGACSEEGRGHYAHVLVRPGKVLYRISGEQDLDAIIKEHVQGGQTVDRLVVKEKPITQDFLDLYGDVRFFNHQTRIAMRNSGIVNPESLEEYVRYGASRPWPRCSAATTRSGSSTKCSRPGCGAAAAAASPPARNGS